MTSAASISSDLASFSCLPMFAYCIMLVFPASSSTNLKASTIMRSDSVRSSAIVIKAIRPDCRQS